MEIETLKNRLDWVNQAFDSKIQNSQIGESQDGNEIRVRSNSLGNDFPESMIDQIIGGDSKASRTNIRNDTKEGPVKFHSPKSVYRTSKIRQPAGSVKVSPFLKIQKQMPKDNVVHNEGISSIAIDSIDDPLTYRNKMDPFDMFESQEKKSIKSEYRKGKAVKTESVSIHKYLITENPNIISPKATTQRLLKTLQSTSYFGPTSGTFRSPKRGTKGAQGRKKAVVTDTNSIFTDKSGQNSIFVDDQSIFQTGSCKQRKVPPKTDQNSYKEPSDPGTPKFKTSMDMKDAKIRGSLNNKRKSNANDRRGRLLPFDTAHIELVDSITKDSKIPGKKSSLFTQSFYGSYSNMLDNWRKKKLAKPTTKVKRTTVRKPKKCSKLSKESASSQNVKNDVDPV